MHHLDDEGGDDDGIDIDRDEKMIFQTLCPPKPFDEDETDFPNSFSLCLVVSVKPTYSYSYLYSVDIFKPNIFIFVFGGQNIICSPLLLSYYTYYTYFLKIYSVIYK